MSNDNRGLLRGIQLQGGVLRLRARAKRRKLLMGSPQSGQQPDIARTDIQDQCSASRCPSRPLVPFTAGDVDLI